MFDYSSAIEAGYIEEGYYVWWGLEDSILYEIAKDELAAMGFEIEGDRLGLGTNMFSGEETLLEMLGYGYLQEELGKYSSYYLEHFE